ncbi:hypothetical protein [Actinoplanes sp. G11-F43]|uniref:hypothetical protein n=1 Tax=Actinoplanes sp. G11-F43 TaxID=3424130 RepID=UPI003D32EB54
MRRTVLGLDRVVSLLLGIALAGLGAALLSWRADWPGGLWRDRRPYPGTGSVQAATGQPWWPWACAAAGTVLVLAAVWWLIAHVPRRPVGALLLPGSDRDGRLLLDPGGPAGIAATVLADTPGVRSAHGRVVRERGRIVVVLTAVAEPHADLDDIAGAADAVTADLRTVLDRDDVVARVTVTVAARRRSISRVD